MLSHFSLFTGIGGIDLAAEWAGFETVGMCEIDDYCRKVLDKHWPDVPKWRDIFELTGEEILDKCGRIDLLSGGFPCQPFSAAGKRKGQADERYLWPEMLRIIREVKPQWVLGENVRGIFSIDAGRTFGRILADLAESGYRVGWLCYGAGDVGAPHKRERVFIVAYAMHLRHGGEDTERRSPAAPEGIPGINRQENRAAGDPFGTDIDKGAGIGNEYVADTEKPKGAMDRPIASEQEQGQFGGRGGEGVLADTKKQGLERANAEGITCSAGCASECGQRGRQADKRTAQCSLGGVLNGFPAGMDGTKWPAGPGEQYPWEPPRIATGIKDRVARLKALGNAVVPQQVYPILKVISEMEWRCNKNH